VIGYAQAGPGSARAVIEPPRASGAFDRRLLGSFLEHLGRAIYTGVYQPGSALADARGFRTDVVREIKTLDVPIVRYPGGNFVSGYNWLDGVGPKVQRPTVLDRAWNSLETNQFGTNDFIDWCRLVGTELLLGMNFGTGTAETAVAYVEYCNLERGTKWSDLRHGTWASSSAITDGQRVFAFFESSGLYAYDMDGTLLWQKHFGDKKMFAEVGESGSTPVLYGNHLVVVWDHQGASFVVALNASTGQEIWRAERQDVDSWGTPLVVEQDGRAQVVTTGDKRVRSYDLDTGRLVWEHDGLGMNPIPSPVAEDGMVFITAGFRSSKLHAIRLADAKGNLAGSRAIAWTLDRDTPYVPSPLLYDGVLYLLKSNSGILSVFDARSGRPHYQLQRLSGLPEVYSSPVAARGRVYITSRDGTTLVIRHGSRFEVLATNTLDDGFDASPALVDRDLYLRGNRYLYCIAEQ
jgi:outer membrane protein assembly factor BamB